MADLTHTERARHFIVGSKLIPEEMTHDDVIRGLAYEFSLVAQEASADLLAALRAVSDDYFTLGDVTEASIKLARAALDKAEGRS